jgi:hypothetical protein
VGTGDECSERERSGGSSSAYCSKIGIIFVLVIIIAAATSAINESKSAITRVSWVFNNTTTASIPKPQTSSLKTSFGTCCKMKCHRCD